jgi:hypothetical protein
MLAHAQFLNVVESVFSGMARAVIQFPCKEFASTVLPDGPIRLQDKEAESRNENYQRRPYSCASVAREQPPLCNGLYALSPGTVSTIFA